MSGLAGSWAREWLGSDKPEAPVILQGPVGAKREQTEEELMRLTVCAQGGCGVCSDCKKVAKRVHPDVVRFDDSEKTLKVKHVRSAREQWIPMPYGKRRLVIIPQAERLTREAANTLLKELEEPTKHNRFLLWTAWPGRLLATIRSRSQIVRLGGKAVAASRPEQADWEEVVSWKRKEPFSEEELAAVFGYLQERLEQGRADAAWFRASLRLRDFYQIASTQGNTKLATDVLLASLHELR